MSTRVTCRKSLGIATPTSTPNSRQTNKRGRDRITRTGQPNAGDARDLSRSIFYARRRNAPASFKNRGSFRGEDIEGADGLLRQSIATLARCVEPDRSNKRRLVAIGVLAGAFAERRFVGLDIQNIVGNLKGRAQRLAIT